MRGRVRRGAVLYLDHALLELVEGGQLLVFLENIHDVLGGVF